MDIRRLLKDKVFFKTIFDVIPVMALIVNHEGRVFRINTAAKNLLGLNTEEEYLQRGGDAFHCINHLDEPRGCGIGPDCENCVIRKSAMSAIHGTIVQRARWKLEIEHNNETKTLNLLISAVPLEYLEFKMAVVIIEDVSKISELEGLIPICASCKNIRDDNGYWTRLEHYIESRSEAEFTHDLCPSCREALKNKQTAKWPA